MSRPVCHLNELVLTPAECGVLLSRVPHAERLEELSLTFFTVSVHSTGTFCSCGQMCTCTFTYGVYYVSVNIMIFGCSQRLYIDVCGCVYTRL